MLGSSGEKVSRAGLVGHLGGRTSGGDGGKGAAGGHCGLCLRIWQVSYQDRLRQNVLDGIQLLESRAQNI